MSIVVMKFGGTSVGSIERIRNVAEIVGRKRDAGNDVVVTVSAMSGETDKLVGLVNEITDNFDLREYDQVVSTGENVTIGLLTMMLQSIGYDAISFTGLQMGMVTSSAHSKARIKKIDTANFKKAISEGKVCVIAGFQGYDPETGYITTLGRGGSDTTAVAVAAALDASVCEIYTDVDGVYTADPRVVPSAKKLDTISHEEMLELSSLGAKVLNSRSVELGMNHDVDIMVLSSMEDKPGTLVTNKEENVERIIVNGVTSDKNQMKIAIKDVPDKVGVAAKIFGTLADNNLNVDMIIQNISEDGKTDMSFTLPRTEGTRAYEVTTEVAKSIGCDSVLQDDKVAKVSIVGVGMKSHSGVASKMFEVLASNNINIHMISTSEIKISVLIDSKYAELAVQELHNEFIG